MQIKSERDELRELVKTLADKLSVTQAEAMRFVQAWEEAATEALESDGSLMLLGFGTFSAWEQNRTDRQKS